MNPNNNINLMEEEESITCDDIDEIEHIIMSLFPTENILSTWLENNKSNILNYQGKTIDFTKQINEYKTTYPISLEQFQSFNFSLIDCFLKDEYTINQMNYQNMSPQDIFIKIRYSLLSYYQWMNCITKSIHSDCDQSYSSMKYLIYTSKNSVVHFLNETRSLFNHSYKQLDILSNIKEKIEPGQLILFADCYSTNGNQTLLKIHGWGCLGLENPFKIALKTFSPVSEFLCQISINSHQQKHQSVQKIQTNSHQNQSFNLLHQTHEIQVYECQNSQLLRSFFSHLISELCLSTDSTNFSFQRKCETKFCTKCNNNSISLQSKDILSCVGCHSYFHSKCLSHSSFCSKECQENIFIPCEFSNRLYPIRTLQRCLVCQKPFVSPFELEVHNKQLFCCHDCLQFIQKYMFQLYIEKCSIATYQKLRDLYRGCTAIKDNPEEFLTFLLTLKDDISMIYSNEM